MKRTNYAEKQQQVNGNASERICTRSSKSIEKATQTAAVEKNDGGKSTDNYTKKDRYPWCFAGQSPPDEEVKLASKRRAGFLKKN